MAAILRSACAVLLLAVLAAAQGRVWIVDAANGPGTDFTDLPPAEAAAAHGDVLMVRAGLYTGIRTGKGIAVVGVPGQTTVQSPNLLPALDVMGVPAGRTFAARDLILLQTFNLAFVRFAACGGAVVLQGIRGGSPRDTTTITFADCAVVVLTDCGGGTGGPLAVWALGTRLAVNASTLVGQYSILDPRVGSSFSSPGLRAGNGSVVWLADTELRGGAGTHEWPYIGNYRPSSPGLRLEGATATIAVGCSIAAGTGATTTLPVSAVDGNGVIDVDPSVPLAPYAAAPPVAPGVVATLRSVSGLAAAGGALGGQVVLTLRSEPATPFVLAAGLAVAPFTTPMGRLFLAPDGLLVLATGVQAAGGTTTVSVPLPMDPRFIGFSLTLQAAAASSGGRVELTNPAAVVAR